MDENPSLNIMNIVASLVKYCLESFITLFANHTFCNSINDCYLKFNWIPNYVKNLYDEHIIIYVKRLSPSFTLFFS